MADILILIFFPNPSAWHRNSMENPVFIHLPVDGNRHLVWAELADGVQCRKERLEQVAQSVAGKQVVAIVPGLDVWLTHVNAPQTSRSNMEKAIPFLLEEQLSSPVEDLHFALGKRREDGTLPVVVVAQSLLARWLEEIQSVGIQPEALICEPLLLPWKPGSWTLLLTPDTAIVRTGLESGFASDPINLAQILTLAHHEQGEQAAKQRHVLDFSHGKVCMDFSKRDIQIHTEKKEGEPLALFAENFKAGAFINLLQGAFAPRDWLSSGWWKPLRLTAVLLAGWLLFRGGYALVETDRLAQQSKALETRIEAQFRTAFPDARRVVDPQAQMSQRLQALRRGDRPKTDAGFLAIMAQAGTVLKTVSGVTLKRMRFQGGKLDLFLHLTDLQQLDQIRQAFEKDQVFSAIIQNANKGKGGVEGNLRIFKR